MSYTNFKPGQEWLDTDGKPIHAHGGKVFVAEDNYYFYGENKETTIPGSKHWHFGVKMYSSYDLYNWKNEGLILPPVENDPMHPLHPTRIMDRPHIIYNKKNRTYVMWMKLVGTNDTPTNWDDSSMGIATSDRITGPFKLVNVFKPLSMHCGDFNLYIEDRDQKAYVIFQRPHTEIVIADLTDDYLNVTGHYSCHFPQPGPPLGREAPAFFKYKSRYYMITSATTGYSPNQSEYAVADLIHGPWKVMGDPCCSDTKHTSFDSQFSAVFSPRNRPDIIIGVADRWKIENVSESTYVWLPIFIDGEVIRIAFFSPWHWESTRS